MPDNLTLAPRRHLLGVLLCSLALLALTCASLFRYGATSLEAQLAQAQKRLKAPAETLLIVRSLVHAAGGNFPAAQLFECQLLLELNRGREARDGFSKISDLETCSPVDLCQFADKARIAGEFALAGQTYLAAGSYVRNSPQRLKALIFVLYSQQNIEEQEDQVLELCVEYARLVPDDAFPWLVSSSLYHERGVPALAIKSYREALKRQLPPEEKDRVLTQLIQLELLLGDLTLAREHCNALLADIHEPKNRSVIDALHADLLQREGKSIEALILLNDLLEKTPGWTQARALRGRCRFDLGDITGAIADLSEVVRTNDFDLQSHYVLGQSYSQQNEQEQALLHLNRSRVLNDLMGQIFTLENQLRNDLHNRELKLQLAELNEKRGDFEKAAAWRRGANQTVRSAKPK